MDEVVQGIDDDSNNSLSDEELLNLSIKMERDANETKTQGSKDDQTEWTLPEHLKKPGEAREILWRGHLTQFGFSKLKGFQRDAIQAVELGRDTVIIQPTASGKSICYQLPALFEKGSFTVVVCPTISLINSQIESLKNHDINAASVGPVTGGSSLQSEYEIEYKYDFSILVFRLHIITTHTHFIP